MDNLRDFFEFEKEYFYSVKVPDFDEDPWQETGKKITVEGCVKFWGDAEWYILSTSWEDYGHNFSPIGEAPDGTYEKFIEDFRDYLISQGVSENEIEHY